MPAPDFLTATEFPLSARSVGEFIERETPRRHPECWLRNETIAEALGLCVRTVREALRVLEAAGLVSLVKDATKKARRVIVLGWRAATRKPRDAQAAENVDHKPRRIRAAAPTSLPLLSSGEGEKDETDDDARPGPVAPPEPAPPPVSSSSSGEGCAAPGGDGKAGTSAGAKAANRAKAESVLGPGGAMKCEALAKSRAYPPAWIPRALAVVEARKAKGAVWNPFGLMVGVLRNWLAEGGPPPEAAPAPSPRAARLAAGAAMLARIIAREGPR